MSHSSNKRSIVKSVIYCFLSFMLAFTLFLFSICMVLRLTIFSPDFMTNVMADTAYNDMVKDELTSSLKSLGDASGLDDEFIKNFVKDIDLIEVETEYISSFYSGEKTLVDTTTFKQNMRNALDKYIEDRNIDKSKANEKNLSYLVDQASDKYVNLVSIPFFSIVGNYIYKLDGPLRTAEIGLGIFALIIAAVIFFTNEYKHRRYKYLCYGCTGAFLAVTVIPAVVFISGFIPKVNIGTRSTYNLFVGYFNSLFMHFWFFSGALLFLSVLTFFLFYTRFKKAIGEG